MGQYDAHRMGRGEEQSEPPEARHSLRNRPRSIRGPFCLTIEDVEVGPEQRFWTIGRLENLQVLVVVHTTDVEDADEITRIISARKATPRERRFYEEAEH